MSNLATRCSAVLIATGLSGLLAACPQQQPPNINVRPIPSTAPPTIGPTSPPGSVIQSPDPSLPSSNPTPTPGTPTNPGTPGIGTGSDQLSIISSTLPTATKDFLYNFGLMVNGGSGSYRWSIIGGNLPNGLSLDQNTGVIFGRPTQTGSFNFNVQVLDNQNSQVATRSLSILVSDSNGGLNSLSVLTTDLPSAVVDRRYSRTLEITGGTAPFSWNISSGSLPDGLSLNTATGEISGTPTLRGEETFTVRVTDARGDSDTEVLSITVNSSDTDISILTSTLPNGVHNTVYNRTACDMTFDGTLRATGGDGSYTWSRSTGSLPSGLTLNSNGTITGTPTLPVGTNTQSFTFTARVQDGDDNAASKVFTVLVSRAAIYSFTPNAGGEDLRVVLFGEGLGNADGGRVLFGGVQSAAAINNAGDLNQIANPFGSTCDRLQTAVPPAAKTGVVALRAVGGQESDILGVSTSAFVAEDVVVSEVFASADSSRSQFVELWNRSSSSVNIAGWLLRYTGDDGNGQDFVLPDNVPPLAPDARTIININRAGGTSATNIYTGTTLREMLFNPNNEFDLNSDGNFTNDTTLTQLALCTSSPCSLTTTNTNYRDFLQFGPVNDIDGGALENDAVTSGVWTDNSTINLTSLSTKMADIETNVGTTANAVIVDNAHYGVSQTADANGFTGGFRTVLQDTGAGAVNIFNGYTNDAVLYYNPTSTAATSTQQRLRRTVTGVGNNVADPDGAGPLVGGDFRDRVTVNQGIFNAAIQSTNTGNGSSGNGLLVDTTSLMAVSDLVNVISGSVIRSISNLTTTPTIELNEIFFVSSQAANISDGTGVPGNSAPGTIGGLDVGANGSTSFEVNDSVSITYFRGANDPNNFTVTRTVTSKPDANHLVLNQALATLTVDGSNTGDGLTGSEVLLTGTSNFRDGDKALFNGRLCADPDPFGAGVGQDPVPCELTFGGSQVRLTTPLARMLVTDTNTGNGSTGNGISVDVAGFTEYPFAIGDTLRVGDFVATIEGIVPSFGGSTPRIELSTDLSMTVDSNNEGDGVNQGVLVPSNAGFAVNNFVSFRGLATTYQITAINPAPGGSGQLLTLNGNLGTTTVPTTNAGDGSANFPLNLTSTTALNLQSGDKILFADINNEVRTVTNVNAGNTVTLNSPIYKQQSTVSATNGAANVGTAGNPIVVNGDLTGVITNGQTRVQFASTSSSAVVTNAVLNGGNTELTFGSAIVPDGATLQNTDVFVLPDGGDVNLAPSSGSFVPRGDAGNTLANEVQLNLVPTSGSFTLVPDDAPTAQVSRIPNSGNVFLAPSGLSTANRLFMRKYLSLTLRDAGVQNKTSYLTGTNLTDPPNAVDPTPGS